MNSYTYLALGDSHTIGEGVERHKIFPIKPYSYCAGKYYHLQHTK